MERAEKESRRLRPESGRGTDELVPEWEAVSGRSPTREEERELARDARFKPAVNAITVAWQGTHEPTDQDVMRMCAARCYRTQKRNQQ